MLSRQLVILGALVSVPIMFLDVVNEVAALVLVGDAEFLSTFDRPQLDSLAYLFLHLHGQGTTVASVFWGLWLFPFGLLLIRCGFIPQFLGFLLLVAGTAYVANAFATLLVPSLSAAIERIALPPEMAELPIIQWLAIWGAWTRSDQPSAT